jgi:urease accessory protein
VELSPPAAKFLPIVLVPALAHDHRRGDEMNVHLPVPPVLQRSRGEAFVELGQVMAKTRLVRLRQKGSAKAILPQVGRVPEVVFLNTSGGLTGGDSLSFKLSLHKDTRAVATTQTAERAYRAGEGYARVTVDLDVGKGSWLDWLPQETILFDASALDRRTTIDLAADAGCLALEAVVLGRPAMGEVVQQVTLRDTRLIRRNGVPVMLEPLALTTASLAAGSAVLGGAKAFASLVMLGQDVDTALTHARAVLDEPGVDGAASAWDGKLSVRMMAVDGWPLRQQIRRVLQAIRHQPLPRVWQL